MLQQIRNPRVMKWTMYVVLVITIPSFVLFYGFSGAPNAQQAAAGFELATFTAPDGTRQKVTNTEVRDAMEATEALYGRLLRMGRRDGLTEGLTGIEKANLGIAHAALLQRAENMGIRVTDQQVSAVLKEAGMTRQQLADFLKARRMSEAEYAQMFRKDIKASLANATVTGGAVPSLLAMWDEYSLGEEKLAVAQVRIPIPPTSSIEVSEADIQARYTEMVEKAEPRVIDAEKRVFQYVREAVPTTMASLPSEEQVRKAYDEADPNDSELQAEARIVVRRVLFRADEATTGVLREQARTRAMGTRERILAGESFAELANRLTEDPQNLRQDDAMSTPTLRGGLMLPIKGIEVDRYGAEFLRFANESPLNDLSGVLETPEGFVVARVEERVPKGKMPFEQAQGVLTRRLLIAEQERLKEEREEKKVVALDRVRQARASESTLEGIARALNQEVRVTSPTLTTAMVIPGLGDLSRESSAMRELVPGNLSPILQNNAGDVIVVRLKEVIPQRTRTINEVRDSIVRAIQQEREIESALARANELKARVRGDVTLTSAALELGLEVTNPEPFARQNPPAEIRGSEELQNRLLAARPGDVLVGKEGQASFVTSVIALQVLDTEQADVEKFIELVPQLHSYMASIRQQAFLEDYRRQVIRESEPKYSDLILPRENDQRRRRQDG